MKKLFFLLVCLSIGLISCAKQSPEDQFVYNNVQACGGAEKLASITDQVGTWEFTMHMMPPGTPEGYAGPMTSPMTITYKRPNKIRFDSYGPDGSVVHTSCYDGTTGWITQMGERQDHNEARLHEAESMAATWIDGFQNYQEKGYTLAARPDEEIDGQNCSVIQVTDKHGAVQTNYVDPESNYIVRTSGNMVNYAGELESMYMTMQDYNMVDGIAIPHHVAQYTESGGMIWEATLKEVKHNTGVEDSYFMAEVTSMK